MFTQIYKHRNDRGLFALNRDQDGNLIWVCVRGNCPGLMGTVNMNMVVPIGYGVILTDEARASGADPELFRRTVKVEEKKKSKRKSAPKTKGRTVSISIFDSEE